MIRAKIEIKEYLFARLTSQFADEKRSRVMLYSNCGLKTINSIQINLILLLVPIRLRECMEGRAT